MGTGVAKTKRKGTRIQAGQPFQRRSGKMSPRQRRACSHVSLIEHVIQSLQLLRNAIEGLRRQWLTVVVGNHAIHALGHGLRRLAHARKRVLGTVYLGHIQMQN